MERRKREEERRKEAREVGRSDWKRKKEGRKMSWFLLRRTTEKKGENEKESNET